MILMTAEPTQPTPGTTPREASGEEFRTTRWTQVSRAKADSPEGRRALAELCDAYYEPVAAFLRCELREADAARELAHGSSYLKLPKLLKFFTANIGLHHVHHLNPRVPNYNLQRAHDANAIFAGVPAVSVRDSLRAVKLKLWDEDLGQLVTFAQANLRRQGVLR